ncbi:hypothetical protein V493_01412, partial [Pseudogymnoascus sp. VKM F-4281 (FW-2241)]
LTTRTEIASVERPKRKRVGGWAGRTTNPKVGGWAGPLANWPASWPTSIVGGSAGTYITLPTKIFNSDIDYDMTSPLSASGSDYPCKGYLSDIGTSAGRSTGYVEAGTEYVFNLRGTATHDGGSCQASLSIDGGTTFKVIKSFIGGCPIENMSYPFKIPSDVPVGPAVFAWTWFNKLGNREMYMNCASLTIGKGSNFAPSVPFASLPDIFVANIGNDCSTAESSNLEFPDPGKDVTRVDSGEFKQPIGLCAQSSRRTSSSSSGSPNDATSRESRTTTTSIEPSHTDVISNASSSGGETKDYCGDGCNPSFGTCSSFSSNAVATNASTRYVTITRTVTDKGDSLTTDTTMTPTGTASITATGTTTSSASASANVSATVSFAEDTFYQLSNEFLTCDYAVGIQIVNGTNSRQLNMSLNGDNDGQLWQIIKVPHVNHRYWLACLFLGKEYRLQLGRSDLINPLMAEADDRVMGQQWFLVKKQDGTWRISNVIVDIEAELGTYSDTYDLFMDMTNNAGTRWTITETRKITAADDFFGYILAQFWAQFWAQILAQILAQFGRNFGAIQGAIPAQFRRNFGAILAQFWRNSGRKFWRNSGAIPVAIQRPDSSLVEFLLWELRHSNGYG